MHAAAPSEKFNEPKIIIKCTQSGKALNLIRRPVIYVIEHGCRSGGGGGYIPQYFTVECHIILTKYLKYKQK